MDTNPEERLSGSLAEVEGQTAVPTSPHGSAISQQSSTSRSSARSSHSSPKSGLRQKTIVCRKHCTTVLACLLVGVMITLGSVAMTVCGYFAMNIASETVRSENSTTVLIDEELHENLNKFRTFGPVMIGFGSFLIMCACVLLCEEKDKKTKSRTQANENLLSEHERIMQEARERFYNENRNALLVESQTVDYRTPKASSNELTSCIECDTNNAMIKVTPLTPSGAETDAVSGASGSPVVLVHGPTIVEPAQCETSDKKHLTNENGFVNNSPSNSNHSSPDRTIGSPARSLKKNNAVGPSHIEDVSSELAIPSTSVLPKIDPSRSSNGVSRAGGAIPKSILVQPLKLSPIRSVNGPIRVRLDDSPTELSPFTPSSASKSAECLPQPRSPGSTPRRIKRGKKKKSAGSLQASGFSQCRCLSDPSMSSARSQDRHVDACCCLQPDCCWGGHCQLDKSIPTSSPSATKSTDDPLADLVATDSKVNIPLLQPLKSDMAVNAQSTELKPKSIGELVAADKENCRNKETILDKHPNGENKMTNKTDAPQPKGAPSLPTSEADSEYLAAGGKNLTQDETNTEAHIIKDRNSNIKVSSTRQDTSGKSVPCSGQAKGGVMV
ncbi:uncharacterized protein LOC110988170 [Acanthaster planci]|uniref:Uncharacterized protein LOC110988170 n=1 Tax=Acanthaster planci TaxID=133434 RepID=A0A8B7ZQ16_ACAPL|nr:uncharacterized protein LOC110988170 [Acanthaster planci]XP_022107148.1 uncharacterized protein LOC110988170 [Acanthaster planci]XP_022107149.1 uncharacterized protein LOC110988170 [Acanthaster planci]XP_022107150.1 uncharacterized protein LOC110988170 [Acanthaster planci]XP_022107152.1 uncharacterized protein LOC110988170 [Acanthaster planci]XP_022107153.1 uncharacterized protein LOC110988170 [Acanthaster planci]